MNEVVLQQQEVQQIVQALSEAQMFLIRRDEMNAAVHCEKTRWSPLTEKVQDALFTLSTTALEQHKKDSK